MTILRPLFTAALRTLQAFITNRRPPDFAIGPTFSPYMLRWWVIPRNRFFNIYLHQIVHDDDDRALHDHPWPSVSFILRGCGIEQTQKGPRSFRAGDVVFRSSRFAHRLEIAGEEVWTLFITGPTLRNWGFHCPKGWVRWQDFCDPTDYGQVGRGCGEHGEEGSNGTGEAEARTETIRPTTTTAPAETGSP